MKRIIILLAALSLVVACTDESKPEHKPEPAAVASADPSRDQARRAQEATVAPPAEEVAPVEEETATASDKTEKRAAVLKRNVEAKAIANLVGPAGGEGGAALDGVGLSATLGGSAGLAAPSGQRGDTVLGHHGAGRVPLGAETPPADGGPPGTEGRHL